MRTHTALGLVALVSAMTALFAYRLSPHFADDASVAELATYATSVRQRTAAQRHNARLAANALDGAIVLPGNTFSFNRRVGNWNADAGYRKAPVSYEGRLVSAFGGGVCQVSSTLYNAVLVAGLPIVERHRHAVAPTYAPPGRDAAVAYDTLDFRFTNSTPRPLRIVARVSGPLLTVRILSAYRPSCRFMLASRILSRSAPRHIVWAEPKGPTDRPTGQKQAYGQSGLRVVTYRIAERDGKEIAREKISDDTYKAVDQVWFLDRPESSPPGPDDPAED